MSKPEQHITTVLLVDDHPLMRSGLRTLLASETELSVVGEASDGEEALEQVRALAPDIVVMDITMPKLNGIEATRQILAEAPASRIVALSIHSEKRFVESMLQAGAAAYVLKDSVPEELVRAMHAVMRGESFLSAPILGIVVSGYRKAEAEPATAVSEQSDQAVAVDVLQTKLHRPDLPRDLVPRTALLERLEAGRTRPLTLVAAGAGYGKSILISSWLEASEWPGAWLSLDEDDGDLRRFLIYCIAAVKTLFPQACEDSLALSSANELPPVSVIATTLGNELDSLERPFILVLEDYHRIEARSLVHDLLQQLLNRPPIPLRLVILTRRDPPLSLVSLHARDQITVVRMEDLRFSKSETRTLLEKTATFSTSDEVLDNLEHEMEGWAVGLRLVSLVLRRVENAERFLENLHGGVQQTREYLLQEVLNRQSPQMRVWLLKSAILDRFCEPLCAAVCATGGVTSRDEFGGEQLHQELFNSDLFVIPLDVRGEWFRYHHLFQDLLQRELKKFISSDEIAGLHSRASKWFAENNLVEAAIRHALAAGDALAAAEIVEQHRHAALDADQMKTLETWLDRLPHEIVQERPELLLTKAWILNLQARIAEIPPIIEHVESLVDEAVTEPALLSEINYFRGFLCYFQGEGARSKAFFARAAELVPKVSFGLIRSQIEMYTCIALHLDGQKETAIRRLHEGIRSTDAQEGMFLSRLLFSLCWIHLLDGDWQQAFQQGLRLREVCISNHLAFPETHSMYVQGNASLRMFNLDAAHHHFSLLMEKRYIHNPRISVDAMAGLAITSQFLGKPDEADETMRLAQEYAHWTNHQGNMEIVHSCQARLALLRGDLDSASRWQRSLVKTPGNSLMLFFLEIPSITECRVLIAIGSDTSLKESMEKLEQFRQKTSEQHNTCQTIEIAVLQSLGLQKQGRENEAGEALQGALELARPGECIRPFVESGRLMAELLQRANKQDANAAFVERILSRFGEVKVETTAGPGRGSQPFSEPLTNRELDILELLAQRLQNKEIATRLFVSPETVKTHLKHLYQKLGVNNRREAAARATEIISSMSATVKSGAITTDREK